MIQTSAKCLQHQDGDAENWFRIVDAILENFGKNEKLDDNIKEMKRKKLFKGKSLF